MLPLTRFSPGFVAPLAPFFLLFLCFSLFSDVREREHHSYFCSAPPLCFCLFYALELYTLFFSVLFLFELCVSSGTVFVASFSCDRVRALLSRSSGSLCRHCSPNHPPTHTRKPTANQQTKRIFFFLFPHAPRTIRRRRGANKQQQSTAALAHVLEKKNTQIIQYPYSCFCAAIADSFALLLALSLSIL